jgi:predicted dinucleotide-binding enzyme
MGSGLGKLWAAKGHEIMFGSRRPANAQRLAQSMGAHVQGGTFADAAAFGEVLVLAIPWTGAQDVLKSVGSLKSKTLVDLMNSWGSDGNPAFGHTTSLAEQVATWAPDAHIVKAFNGIYAEHLGNSMFEVYDERLILWAIADSRKR